MSTSSFTPINSIKFLKDQIFREDLILTIILIISLFLRVWQLPERMVFSGETNNMLYYVESYLRGEKPILMGLEAAQYVHHLFHLPWYLWLMIPLFIFGNGNPLVFAWFHAVIGVVNTFLLYWIGSRWSRRAGIVAAILYAVWMKTITIDRFVSPVSLVPFGVITSIWLFLWARSRPSIWRFFLVGFWVGVAVSFHYALLSLVAVLFIVLTLESIQNSFPVIARSPEPVEGRRGNPEQCDVPSLNEGSHTQCGSRARSFAYAQDDETSDRHGLHKGLAMTTVLGLVVAFLPMVVFDLRHQFFNLTGLWYVTQSLFDETRPYSSSHFSYQLLPIAILIVVWILSKTARSISVIAIIVFAVVQLHQFIAYEIHPNYQDRVTVVEDILSQWNNGVSVYFQDESSFDYGYLLKFEATRRGLDRKMIEIYEPWQPENSAMIVISDNQVSKKSLR